MRRTNDSWGNLEKFEQVLQIDRSLRDGGKSVQDTLQQTPQLPERSRQKSQIAYGEMTMYGPKDDDYIGTVITRTAQQGEECAPRRPAYSQLAAVPIELVGYNTEPVHQETR